MGYSSRPETVSYDSGYEHSLEHWSDVQRLVAAADAEEAAPPKPMCRAEVPLRVAATAVFVQGD
jgi:hypothetical protein